MPVSVSYTHKKELIIMSKARANSKLTTEQEVVYTQELAKRTSRMTRLKQLMDQHPAPFWFVTLVGTLTIVSSLCQLVYTLRHW